MKERQTDLEAVGVSALLLTDLAEPAELLEALGFDAVGDRLGRQEAISLSHLSTKMKRMK